MKPPNYVYVYTRNLAICENYQYNSECVVLCCRVLQCVAVYCVFVVGAAPFSRVERGGAGVETQKKVRGEIGGWGRVPFNETYAPSLSTFYDGA